MSINLAHELEVHLSRQAEVRLELFSLIENARIHLVQIEPIDHGYDHIMIEPKLKVTIEIGTNHLTGDEINDIYSRTSIFCG
jgi:hypothetical protein